MQFNCVAKTSMRVVKLSRFMLCKSEHIKFGSSRHNSTEIPLENSPKRKQPKFFSVYLIEIRCFFVSNFISTFFFLLWAHNLLHSDITRHDVYWKIKFIFGSFCFCSVCSFVGKALMCFEWLYSLRFRWFFKVFGQKYDIFVCITVATSWIQLK